MKYIVDSITAYAEGNEQKIGIRVNATDDKGRELVSSLIAVSPEELRAAMRGKSLRGMIQKLIEQHPALKKANLEKISATLDAEADALKLAAEINALLANEKIVNGDTAISILLPKVESVLEPIPEELKPEEPTPEEPKQEEPVEVEKEIEVQQDAGLVEKKTWLDKVKAWVRG